MLTFLVATKKCPKIHKSNENSQFWRGKSSYLPKGKRNYNEIFRKHVAYDNVENHRKSGFLSLSGKYIIRKTTGGSNWTLTVFLGLNDSFLFIKKSNLHNFADENFMCGFFRDIDLVIHILKEKSENAIAYFDNNMIKKILVNFRIWF